MLVLAILDPPVHAVELGVELLAEGRQRLFDRCEQDGRPDLAQHRVLSFPALGADQVVFETTEVVAVPDIYVARLQGIAQQAVDQELVAIDLELFVLALPGRRVHIALQILRDDCGREILGFHLAGRFALSQQILQKDDGFEERCVLDHAGEIQAVEQVAQIKLEFVLPTSPLCEETEGGTDLFPLHDKLSLSAKKWPTWE